MSLSVTKDVIMLYAAFNSWMGNMYCNVFDMGFGMYGMSVVRKVGLENRRHVYRQIGGDSRMMIAMPIDNNNDGSVVAAEEDFVLDFLFFAAALFLFFFFLPSSLVVVILVLLLLFIKLIQ